MLGFLKKPSGKFWFVIVAWKLEKLRTAAAWLPHFTKFSLGFLVFFLELVDCSDCQLLPVISQLFHLLKLGFAFVVCEEGDTRKSVFHEAMSSVSEEELQF